MWTKALLMLAAKIHMNGSKLQKKIKIKNRPKRFLPIIKDIYIYKDWNFEELVLTHMQRNWRNNNIGGGVAIADSWKKNVG